MTFRPPSVDLSRKMSPPCDLAISRDIVIPNPLPPIDLFLDLLDAGINNECISDFEFNYMDQFALLVDCLSELYLFSRCGFWRTQHHAHGNPRPNS